MKKYNRLAACLLALSVFNKKSETSTKRN